MSPLPLLSPIPPLRHFARPAPPAFWTLGDGLVLSNFWTLGDRLIRHFVAIPPHISLTFRNFRLPLHNPSAFRHYAARPIIFLAFYSPFQLF